MLKKGKITEYLNNRNQYSLFDELLDLYVSAKLKRLLQSWSLTSIFIYVDWKEEYKCIDVQARAKKYYYEWQFMETCCEYMIYIDGNEPETPICIEYADLKNIQDLLDRMYSLIPA